DYYCAAWDNSLNSPVI
nr:immunoglobulin light chain junction region [Macaca mulatta]MOV97892.1 immunoglobulin light chain junction region [Macaca mulatta]MOV99710.1 immunoglobulin light chain junction region [Macaca mulatta]MOW00782.1 immunoglobulin light chain junction region [Macaca mulatta]